MQSHFAYIHAIDPDCSLFQLTQSEQDLENGTFACTSPPHNPHFHRSLHSEGQVSHRRLKGGSVSHGDFLEGEGALGGPDSKRLVTRNGKVALWWKLGVGDDALGGGH